MEDKGIYIPFRRRRFSAHRPETFVRSLALELFTGWRPDGELKVTRLNEGTTNSLFKAEFKKNFPGSSRTNEVVLIKVYGDGTETTIDRRKELRFHEILADHHLASALLVQFDNGHAYEFVPGSVCSLQDMSNERVWRGVARELARWHTLLPGPRSILQERVNSLGHPSCLPEDILEHQPNVWVTAEKWLHAIPGDIAVKESLKKEFGYLVERLVPNGQYRAGEMVFGHGDLLHGNIILGLDSAKKGISDGIAAVTFIDYEHCTYCPAAFDLANHFAEWAGFNCDYDLLPNRSIRKKFIREYVATQRKLAGIGLPMDEKAQSEEGVIMRLMGDVDNYRGFPGFYWSLCALIQAEAATGAIDFDYARYAKLRLGEYWAWREEEDGSRSRRGEEMPLRERRWAAEC